MLIYWTACMASILFAFLGMKVRYSEHTTLKKVKFIFGNLEKVRIKYGKHGISDPHNHAENHNVWYYLKLSFFAALPLILIAAIRYDVGQDYLYTYVPYFLRVKSGTVSHQLEPLYHLMNVIVIRLHGNYPWVFAICAIIFMTLVYYRVFTDSPYPLISIFLLVAMTYYFIFLNAMRQMVACSILMLSYPYARERKFLKFTSIVVIASLFHSSCVVFLFAYWLVNLKIRPKWILAVTVCVFLFGQFFGNIINNLVRYTAYSIYQGSRFDTEKQGWIVLLMNLAVFLLASVYYTKDKKYVQYYNLQVIALWIAALTGKVVLISRIRWMFGLPGIILVPMILQNIKKRDRLLIGTIIVVLYFVYASYTIGVKNGNNVLPYQTIFSIR